MSYTNDSPSPIPILYHVAIGLLTLTGNPSNTETVTIGSKVYTFQTSLTNVDGNVKIGADAAASIANLIAAINLAAGAGTTYATAMTLNASVTASANASSTSKMNVTAKVNGPAGLAIATTETLSSGSWGAVTLTFPSPTAATLASTAFTNTSPTVALLPALEGGTAEVTVDVVIPGQVDLPDPLIGIEVGEYTIIAGDVVALVGQTDKSENGIYVATLVAAVRDSRFSRGPDLDGRKFTNSEGSPRSYLFSAPAPFVMDTSDIYVTDVTDV